MAKGKKLTQKERFLIFEPSQNEKSAKQIANHIEKERSTVQGSPKWALGPIGPISWAPGPTKNLYVKWALGLPCCGPRLEFC